MLALEYTATLTDRASAGFGDLTRHIQHVKTVSKEMSDQAAVMGNKLDRLAKNLGATRIAGQQAGEGLGHATRAFKSMAAEGLGPIANQIPGVANLFGDLLQRLGGFPLVIGAAVGAGAALISWLKDVQNEADRALVSVTNVSAGIAGRTRELTLEVRAIQARAAGDRWTEVQATADKAIAEAARERDARLRIAKEIRDEELRSLASTFFESSRQAALTKFKTAEAEIIDEFNRREVLARATLGAEMIGIMKNQVEREKQLAGDAETHRRALLSGTAELFRSLSLPKTAERFAILEGLEDARPKLEKLQELFNAGVLSASEFRDSVDKIRAGLERLGATSSQINALMSKELSSTAETAEAQAKRMTAAWDRMFDAARRGATSFSQEGPGGFTHALEEGTEAAREQERALTGESLDDSIETVGAVAVDTTHALQGMTEGAREARDAAKLGWPTTVTPGGRGIAPVSQAEINRYRFGPDLRDLTPAQQEAVLRGSGLLDPGTLAELDKMHDAAKGARVGLDRLGDVGDRASHAIDTFLPPGFTGKLPGLEDGKSGGGPLGATLGGGGGGGGGFASFISSLGLLLSYRNPPGLGGPPPELFADLARLAGIYRQATGGGALGGGANVASAAGGGFVPGAPGEPVPILAHAGEVVIPADVVRRYTSNRVRGRRFQRGGFVEGRGFTTTFARLGGGGEALGIGRGGIMIELSGPTFLEDQRSIGRLAERIRRKVSDNRRRLA